MNDLLVFMVVFLEYQYKEIYIDFQNKTRQNIELLWYKFGRGLV